MMKKIALFVTTLLVLGAGVGAVSAADKLVWKLGHSAYENDPIYFFAEKVKEGIEKELADKVELQLFPAGQLGDYVAQQELMQVGGLEFSIPVTVSLASIIPEFGLPAVNFILSQNASVNDKAFNEGKAFASLEEKLDLQGIKIIRWVAEDFSCWSSNTPIRKLEDLQGLKIRVYPSAQIIENYRAIKANPTPIPFAEVYSALQLNVAGAQENPIAVIYSNKFYEVQKYVTISNHTAPIDALAASKDFWDSLSEEDREKIKKVVDEAAMDMFERQENSTKVAMEKIKDFGNTTFIELDPSERNRIVEASSPARDVYLKTGGADAKAILDLWVEDMKKFETSSPK